MLEAILFDLDGLLVDSRAPVAQSINFALRELDIAGFPEPDLYQYIGPPIRNSFEELLEIRGRSKDLADRCVELYRVRYRSIYLTETPVVPGMREVIERIGRWLPLAVATSKPAPLARPLLEAIGLAGHFRVIEGPSLDPKAGSETKSETVARALAALHVDGPAAIIVGDRHHDIEAGLAHGLVTCGATWGIGDHRELREAGAHHIVESPPDLSALLESIAIAARSSPP